MENNLLPHLEHSLPSDITTAHVSYYPVVLEAWRRGLKVTFYNTKRGSIFPSYAHRYTISDGENEYEFLCARGPHTTQEAIDITQNKSRAYPYYKKAGVPIPEGATFDFSTSTIEEISEYGHSIGYPLVVKPSSLGGGRGVHTHIHNFEQLVEAIKNVNNLTKSKDVMVERYFTGIDYRFFVMKDRVIGVTKSYSPYIMGDGKNDIKSLIKIMNQTIKNNRSHQKRPIRIDKNLNAYLEERGLDLNYIPNNGDRVFMRKHGTYLSQRYNVDCTDDIDPKFKDYAVKAINSVPGIPYGSVDMIINEETNEGIVNEINTKGEISMHISPIEGKSRDIPSSIIDYYFPDSKRINDRLYFEMKPLKDLFLNGLAQEIVVPPIPLEELYKCSIEIKAKEFSERYLTRIHKKAALNHLMGTITISNQGQINMVLYGNKAALTKFESYLRKRKPTKQEIIINSTDLEIDQDYHNISLDFINNINNFSN